MFNIKKLNAISKVVYDYLPKENYNVSSHIEEGEVDAYILRSAKCHDMDLNDRILAFARAGAGVNNIPIEKCTEKGIVVFNTPGANANGVKELVFAGMLLASRNLIEAANWAQSLKGKGDEVEALVESGKKQFVGPELKGKTLGVIGLGAIGAMVANAAVAVGMEVIGYDPFLSVDNAWNMSRAVHRASSIDDLLTKADYLTIHVPYSEKTKDYLSGAEFAKMKPGMILMNFARGGLIKETSLFEALENGTVAKYVTDFPNEALLGHENIIAIPHLGASTPESEENCAIMASKQLYDYLEKGSIKNSVNMPTCILGDVIGQRITIIHKNLPNMVGQITAILAKENKNISEMVNKSRNDIAYTALSVDGIVEDAILKEIEAIDGVIKVRSIK